MKRLIDTIDKQERWAIKPLEREMLKAALLAALENHEGGQPTAQTFMWEQLLGDLS